ncbi:MAG: DUF6350 family protein [Propionibacteriaceae bacterium]
MASLLSPRRTEPDIALRATVARNDVATDEGAEPEPPRVSWLLAAVGGSLAVALSGWILIAGLTVIGWLAADPGTMVGALQVGTELWLLANGAGATLGDTSITLIPWAATLVFAFMLSRFAAFAARQCRGGPAAAVGSVAAIMILSYAAPVVGAAMFVNGPGSAVRAVVSTVVVVGLAACWGSSRALSYAPTRSWPVWTRPIPRAVLGAQLAMVVTGAAALAASIVLHLDRVLALTNSLEAGLAGGIILTVAQLAFLPNAVIWAASYTLGAGFSLGQATIVSPASTQLGILPSVPLLGALPSTGPGTMNELWWLAAGALAGAVAAWLVMRARPAARFDETSLVGGLSGLLAGLVFVALAWASGGDLGSDRLAGVGPRLLPLLLLSATTMGLAGMLVGLVLGLVRRPGRRRASAAEVDEDDSEDTVHLRNDDSEDTVHLDAEPTTQLKR